MRVLGIDLGLKRTGLALSDALGVSTRGLENLTPGSRAADVAFLVALIDREEVEAVAIGLPLMPQSGDESPMSRRARGFAAALEAALGEANMAVSVHLIDERGSSSAAAARLVASEVRRSQRKALLDSEAARVLAEDLIAQLRRPHLPTNTDL